MLTLKNSLLGILILGVCLIVMGCSGAAANEPVAPEASVLVEAALPVQPVTGGPPSYAYDTITLVAILAAEQNRPELESMKQIDLKTLRGPSSYAYDTITLIAILAAAEQNRPELED